MRKAVLFVTIAAGAAAVAMAVGGFLAVVGTVKMFMWAGIEGVVAYWALLMIAIVALLYKLPGQPLDTESATARWREWRRSRRVGIRPRLGTPLRSRR